MTSSRIIAREMVRLFVPSDDPETRFFLLFLDLQEHKRTSELVDGDRYQRQGKLTGRSGEEKVKAISGDIVNAAATTDVK